MGSNGVVSIRVEALGVSITIADGRIAIEQTSTEIPTAGVAPKVERSAVASRQALSESPGIPVQASPSSEAIPASARQIPAQPIQPVAEHAPLLSEGNDSTIRATSKTPVIDEREQTPHRPSPPGRNGPAGLPSDPDKGQVARSSQTKPIWSNEEIEKLTALYPTHSASAIAKQLGREFNAVRSKAQKLGLKKAAPPTVIVKPSPREAKPARKPRPLSAAVTADPAPVPDGFSAVSLFDHQPGQCRWIISDVWPVIYCGAPVVDSSSWCEQHSKRVFNLRPQAMGASPYWISKRFR